MVDRGRGFLYVCVCVCVCVCLFVMENNMIEYKRKMD